MDIEKELNAIHAVVPAENKNFMGDTRRVTLPNSRINAYLSYAWWQDFPEWENQEYTIPHLAAEMGFDQYVNNKDPLLEIALNYTETGFILTLCSILPIYLCKGNGAINGRCNKNRE